MGGGFYSCAQRHCLFEPVNGRADQLLRQPSGSGPLHYISVSGGEIFQSANLFFVLSGIIQPATVRVMFYVGIVRLGISRSGPIRGTSPFFSVAIAFFLFRERPELIVYVGGLLTIAGTWLVSYKRVGEAQWRAIDLLFSLGAAMLASVSQKIRKAGLNSPMNRSLPLPLRQRRRWYACLAPCCSLEKNSR